MLRASYGAEQLPHTRERPGVALAGLIIRALLAMSLIALAVALLLLTRELALWRAHVPGVMDQSTAWQKQTAGIQAQTAQLQPKIDAALTVTQEIVDETERVRREIPPMIREVERARETVRSALPRVDGVIERIDAIEKTLPEVLKTTNDAVTQAKRANDALPGVLQEVRDTRAEAEHLVAQAEQVIRDSRSAGKKASEGAVAGFFTGIFKLPFTPVEALRRDHQDNLDFEKHLSEGDKQALQQHSVAALNDPKLGKTYSWHDDDSGNSGTVVARRSYQRMGRPCRELAYSVNLKHGGANHKAHLEACQEQSGFHAGEWQVTGVTQD